MTAPSSESMAGREGVRPAAPVATSGWRTHAYRVAPLLVALCGIYALIGGARDLKVGSLSKAGPGMWPLIVSSVLALTALLLVVRDHPDDYEPWTRHSLKAVAGFAALGAFVGFFSVLGFLLSSVLILFVWMRFMAGESLVMSLPLSVAGTFALNFIFGDVFSVPFPVGLIGIS